MSTNQPDRIAIIAARYHDQLIPLSEFLDANLRLICEYCLAETGVDSLITGMTDIQIATRLTSLARGCVVYEPLPVDFILMGLCIKNAVYTISHAEHRG